MQKTGLHVEDPYSNAHYFDEIRDFYSDLYFNVSIKDASKEKHTYREMFPGYVADCEVPDDSENLFWVKIVFPEIFTKESLEKSGSIFEHISGCKQTNRLQTA